MNLNINPFFSIIFLTSLSISQLAHTDNVLKEINLELSGTIKTWACGIMSAESEKNISLGKHSTKNLSSFGDRSVAVPIPLSLNSCPPNGTVNITITGSKDSINNELLALDNSSTAKNIAIEIRDQNKKRIPIGSNTIGLTADSTGNLSTVLYANYIVTKAQGEIGTANSKMQFSIEYE
jgi:type 1 fimbria pilin